MVAAWRSAVLDEASMVEAESEMERRKAIEKREPGGQEESFSDAEEAAVGAVDVVVADDDDAAAGPGVGEPRRCPCPPKGLYFFLGGT